MNDIARRVIHVGFAAVLPLLALFGCDERGSGEQRFQLSPEQARDWSYFDLAEAFGRDLVDGNPDNAWQLMSQRFQESTTREAFEAELRRVIETYGRPVDVKADDLRTGESLHGHLGGFDASVPDAMRAARVGLQLATRVAPDDALLFEQWYYCWVYIVDEGDGEYAIDGYEFVEPVIPGLGGGGENNQ